MGQDEEMGMTVESAMQLVSMMAAELDLVEYRIPLGKKGGKGKERWGYLYLPKDFKVTDPQRMSGWIRALVMEEAERVEVDGEDPIVQRNRKLLEAYERQENRKSETERLRKATYGRVKRRVKPD